MTRHALIGTRLSGGERWKRDGTAGNGNSKDDGPERSLHHDARYPMIVKAIK